MKNFFLSTCLLILLSFSATCQAIDLASLNFFRQIKIGNNVLFLNGSGFRKVTFFRIKVYAIGLYLETPSQDAQAILNSSGVKKILLKFVRSVGKDTLYSAFEDSVRDNYSDWRNLAVELGQLKQNMPDVSDGDSIEFILLPEAVYIRHNQINEVQIKTKNFQQAILSIWLGPVPAGSDLKSAILGHSD